MNEPVNTLPEPASMPAAPGLGRPSRKALVIGIAVIAGLVITGFVLQAGKGSSSAALPPGTLAGVATEVEGKLVQLLVKEGDAVEEGQLIAVIDDALYVQAVEQARQELNVLAAEANQEGVAVAMPTPAELFGGTIIQTRPFTVPKGEVSGSLPAVGDKPSTTSTAPVVGVEKAQKFLEDTKAALATSVEKVASLQNEINTANANREAAQSKHDTAKKSLTAAQSMLDRAKLDRDKMRMLLAQGAVAAKDASRSEVTYQSALAAVNSFQATVDTSAAAIESGNETIKKLGDDLVAAKEAVSQAESAVKSAESALEQAKKVPATPSFTKPAGDLPPAKFSPKPGYVKMNGGISQKEMTSPAPVEVDKGLKRETDKKMLDVQAKIDAAERDLERTKIYATKAGRIYKVHVKVGDNLAAGRVIVMIR